MALTIAQRGVLRLVESRGVRVFCDKCVWHFRETETGDAINRRSVKALEAAGLLSISYYRDGAGVSLTEAGRAYLQKARRVAGR